MSDEIAISSGDLEEIYYSVSSVEVFSGLLKKTKVYVISRECDLKQKLHAEVEKDLTGLPTSYMARWITTESFLRSSNGKDKLEELKFTKKGSLFDARAEDLHRKYKPKYHSKLHLSWSEAEGRVTQLDKSTFKLNGLPAASSNLKT